MKIICIGRNYANHINELGSERPLEPVFFLKPDSAVLPKKMPFFIPPFSDNVHFEVEVVVKINKVGKYIDQKFAHKYYDEIGLGIDFTARDVQEQCKEKGLPWEKAKAFDGSAVVGSFFKKHTLGQEGTTQSMLWSVDELIAYVSQFLTLKKGDLIFTGTPSGVGPVTKEDLLLGTINGQKAFEIKVK